MQNPFEIIDQRLTRIENLLIEQKNASNFTSKQEDRWFDLVELCTYLPDKPTKATIYAWVHNRRIPFHKKSKKLIFLKSDIDDWLKRGRQKTADEKRRIADIHTKFQNK